MITLKVTGGAQLVGYPFFWVKGVQGFDPSEHCAKCLPGPFLVNWQRPFPMNQEIHLKMPKSCRSIYICGVADAGYRHNLHAPIIPDALAPVIEIPMVMGQTMFIHGAHLLEIPALPANWKGRNSSFTTCRNFQFGVAYFGPEGTVRPSARLPEL